MKYFVNTHILFHHTKILEQTNNDTVCKYKKLLMKMVWFPV